MQRRITSKVDWNELGLNLSFLFVVLNQGAYPIAASTNLVRTHAYVAKDLHSVLVSERWMVILERE